MPDTNTITGSLHLGPGKHDELVVRLPFVPVTFSSSIEANASWHCGGPDRDFVAVALDGDTLYIEAVVEGPKVVVRYVAEA